MQFNDVFVGHNMVLFDLLTGVFVDSPDARKTQILSNVTVHGFSHINDCTAHWECVGLVAIGFFAGALV
jgi:hypothetical protein